MITDDKTLTCELADLTDSISIKAKDKKTMVGLLIAVLDKFGITGDWEVMISRYGNEVPVSEISVSAKDKRITLITE